MTDETPRESTTETTWSTRVGDQQPAQPATWAAAFRTLFAGVGFALVIVAAGYAVHLAR